MENKEWMIKLFFDTMIKPKVPEDKGEYKSTFPLEMIVYVEPPRADIHFYAKRKRNPIYMIRDEVYDCGVYSMLDIEHFIYLYEQVKVKEVKPYVFKNSN